jgi:hypothetical protein
MEGRAFMIKKASKSDMLVKKHVEAMVACPTLDEKSRYLVTVKGIDGENVAALVLIAYAALCRDGVLVTGTFLTNIAWNAKDPFAALNEFNAAVKRAMPRFF